MYYAGLTLHRRYFTLCVLTSEGQVVLDHRRLPAALEPWSPIPKQVKLISHARCKTDPIDARKLADLARTNLLPTIWVGS